MGLVNLTSIHLEWLDIRNSSAIVTILLISDDTQASTIRVQTIYLASMARSWLPTYFDARMKPHRLHAPLRH